MPFYRLLAFLPLMAFAAGCGPEDNVVTYYAEYDADGHLTRAEFYGGVAESDYYGTYDNGLLEGIEFYDGIADTGVYDVLDVDGNGRLHPDAYGDSVFFEDHDQNGGDVLEEREFYHGVYDACDVEADEQLTREEYERGAEDYGIL